MSELDICDRVRVIDLEVVKGEVKTRPKGRIPKHSANLVLNAIITGSEQLDGFPEHRLCVFCTEIVIM